MSDASKISWRMAHEACKGCNEVGRGRMQAHPLGPLVALQMRAKKRVTCVPKWSGAAMRTLPLGPLVELPIGPRSA
eukprot:6052735-Pyramimonas_sp.AAC.1